MVTARSPNYTTLRDATNRDAAAQLFVSPRTVDFHLRNIFAKTQVSSRAELAVLQLD